MADNLDEFNRGGRTRADGMPMTRASLDGGRPTGQEYDDGFQSSEYYNRPQGDRYDATNSSHGNLVDLDEAKQTAVAAQSLEPLPRRPVGLVSSKPSRSESAALGDDVPTDFAPSGGAHTFPHTSGAAEGEHDGEYQPSSYFAARAASGALEPHQIGGINRQSSHLQLEDLPAKS
mmetsp:Transcript_13588/g.41069  ORF Transcript_13588/g.41069 Transcript_13588/m.41069 type:complete len:175 (+) Transcript_13588:79-603(+)